MKTAADSPMKFLNPYNKGDKKIFFGRDKEIRELYSFVNKNRIVLIYGQSGTGKTSIVQCGLANEFELTEWNPFFLRRGLDINDSILNALADKNLSPDADDLEAMKNRLFPVQSDQENTNLSEAGRYSDQDIKIITDIAARLQNATKYYMRPVYLIFDQFEELLILGREEEKLRFIKIVKVLLSGLTAADCHIIIIMREEFFAWLDSFEREIPGIVDRRLRIEPMRRPETAEVIRLTCKAFNITLQEPDHNIDQIISSLSKHGNAELPYLQVYLDQFWKDDFKRTYEWGYTGEEEFPPLEFTTAEITEFGKIKDVMHRFLIEQKGIFLSEAKKMEMEIPETFIDDFLDCFVNEHGTKKPLPFTMSNGNYYFPEAGKTVLLNSSEQLINFSIEFLLKSQIIRNDGHNFELGHDSLAKLIEQRRDSKIQHLNRIRIMISHHHKYEEVIPYELVRKWEPYLNVLHLKKEEHDYFLVYRDAADRKDKETRNKLRKTIIKAAVGVSLAVFVLFLSVGFLFRNSEANKYLAYDMLSATDTIKNKTDAILIAKYAYDYNTGDTVYKKKIAGEAMRILQSQDFIKVFQKFHLKVENTNRLYEGIDIDISGNGKYLVLKSPQKDLSENNRLRFRVSLYRVGNSKPVLTMSNAYCSYFIGHSDTLLIAKQDTTNYFYGSSDFILYDCKNSRLIGKVSLSDFAKNTALITREMLFYKSMMNENYFVRRINGQLLIPFKSLTSDLFILDQNKVIITNTDNTQATAYSTDIPVKISRDGKTGLFATFGKDNIEGSLLKKVSNFMIQYDLEKLNYADFTQTGHILLSSRDSNLLMITDYEGKVLKRIRHSTAIGQIYKADDQFLIGLNQDSIIAVINFQKPENNLFIKESLIAYSLKSRQIITQNKKTNELVLRDFYGNIIKKIAFGAQASEVLVNEKNNLMMIKTVLDAKTNLHSVFVFDRQLNLRASFFLTLNDCFDFSDDGKTIYYVRDNDLSVFNVKDMKVLTSFSKVYDWTKTTSEKKSRIFPSTINDILGKYNFKKFNVLAW